MWGKGEQLGHRNFSSENTGIRMVDTRTMCVGATLPQEVRPTFAAPWTGAQWAPLFLGFSRQEYWTRLPCLPPGVCLCMNIDVCV